MRKKRRRVNMSISAECVASNYVPKKRSRPFGESRFVPVIRRKEKKTIENDAIRPLISLEIRHFSNTPRTFPLMIHSLEMWHIFERTIRQDSDDEVYASVHFGH